MPFRCRKCTLDISALQRFLELLKLHIFPVSEAETIFVGPGLEALVTVFVHALFAGTSLSSPIWRLFIPALRSSPQDPTHFHFKCLTVKMSLFLIKSSSQQ